MSKSTPESKQIWISQSSVSVYAIFSECWLPFARDSENVNIVKCKEMPLTLKSHKTISCTPLIWKLQLINSSIEGMTSAATGSELRFQEAERFLEEPNRK